MNRNMIPLIITLLILLIIPLFMFRLREGEQAVITVFGKPREEALLDPGLKFRLPWWKVQRFEKRILRWDGDASAPLNTAEQNIIHLDTTARWRISDPLKFYQSVKTIEMARLRLDDIIDSVVRTWVSKNNLLELVRNSNRVPKTPDADDASDNRAELKWDNISLGRDKVMDEVITQARPLLTEKMGIDLIDVRIKRLNYVREVEESIFARMIAERQRIAQHYRSEGEGEKANILGTMERELQLIQSEAYRDAQRIEGEADAEAARIYAEAFNRDAEFYAFVQTLASYQRTLSRNTKLITSTKGDYFKYLKDADK